MTRILLRLTAPGAILGVAPAIWGAITRIFLRLIALLFFA
jgi:hypothetical protein